jgi:hypothetical protein
LLWFHLESYRQTLKSSRPGVPLAVILIYMKSYMKSVSLSATCVAAQASPHPPAPECLPCLQQIGSWLQVPMLEGGERERRDFPPEIFSRSWCQLVSSSGPGALQSEAPPGCYCSRCPRPPSAEANAPETSAYTMFQLRAA